MRNRDRQALPGRPVTAKNLVLQVTDELFGAARADLRCTESIPGEGAIHLRCVIR
jgi:hypothetical protein